MGEVIQLHPGGAGFARFVDDLSAVGEKLDAIAKAKKIAVHAGVVTTDPLEDMRLSSVRLNIAQTLRELDEVWGFDEVDQTLAIDLEKMAGDLMRALPVLTRIGQQIADAKADGATAIEGGT
jgi:hypothetical protein